MEQDHDPSPAPPATGANRSHVNDGAGEDSVTVIPTLGVRLEAVKATVLMEARDGPPDADELALIAWGSDGGHPGREEPEDEAPLSPPNPPERAARIATAWLRVETYLRGLVRSQLRRARLGLAVHWARRLAPGGALRSSHAVQRTLDDEDVIARIADHVLHVLILRLRRGMLPTSRRDFHARVATIARDITRRCANRVAAPRFLCPPARERPANGANPEEVAMARDDLAHALTGIDTLLEPHRSALHRQLARAEAEERGLCVPPLTSAERKLLERARRALGVALGADAPPRYPGRRRRRGRADAGLTPVG